MQGHSEGGARGGSAPPPWNIYISLVSFTGELAVKLNKLQVIKSFQLT